MHLAQDAMPCHDVTLQCVVTGRPACCSFEQCISKTARASAKVVGTGQLHAGTQKPVNSDP